MWMMVPSLSTTRALDGSTLDTVPIWKGRAPCGAVGALVEEPGVAADGRKSTGCALRTNTDAPGTTEPTVTGCHTVVPGTMRITRPSCSVIVPVAESTLATTPVASTRGAVDAIPGAGGDDTAGDVDDAGAFVTEAGGPPGCTTTVPGVAAAPELTNTQPG